MKHRTQRSRVATYSSVDPGLYSDHGATCNAGVPFTPGAPPSPAITPVSPRNTPYVTEPQNCWKNLGTGQVMCMNNESYGQLSPFDGMGPVSGMRSSSPLARILTREPVGPWKLTGFAVTEAPDAAQSRDRTMMVYTQSVDTRRDRYNYRVVDSNGVPLDVGEKVRWKMDGETLTVPGQAATYTLRLYPNYR